MKRAIVVYLENKRDLLLQFGCLYTSWLIVNDISTDLIVFGPKDTLKLVPNNCIKVEASMHFPAYPYLNSISCLAEEQAYFLEEYDYIMRTDVDTFITPSWKTFYPITYSVGKGIYVNEDSVKEKLRNISNRFGLRHNGLHNLGSTHYGPSQLVRNVCKLSMFVAKHILLHEFKDSEGRWPGWYRGVTTMYSNEIAVNHLIKDVKREDTKLDYDSSSNQNIQDHPHIHCWHTDKVFSKFEFAKGAYNNIKINNLDVQKVNEYCLYVALRTVEELIMVKSLLNQIE